MTVYDNLPAAQLGGLVLTNNHKTLLTDVYAVPGFDGLVFADDYDAEGGWQYGDVDTVKTRVYTKYLTGTTDAGPATHTDVAHGVTLANILSIQTVIDGRAGCDGTEIVSVVAGAANIVMTYDVGHAAKGYSIRIDYTA